MFSPQQFDSINGLVGLSERLMTEHYKLYEGYVKKANEILEKLKSVDKASANATYSDLRALKMGYAFALGAIKSHELYFSHLGGTTRAPGDILAKLIERDFGGFDAWSEDLAKTGIAARGWVWTAWDWDTKTIFNFLGDSHDAFPIWNATPLVALDVYEHAYFSDYGVGRADYIQAFLKNLDWAVIEKRSVDHGITI